MKRFICIALIVCILSMSCLVPIAHAEALTLGVAAGVVAVLALAGVTFSVEGGRSSLFSAVQKMVADAYAAGVFIYNSLSELFSIWSTGISFGVQRVFVDTPVYEDILDLRDWAISNYSLSSGGTAVLSSTVTIDSLPVSTFASAPVSGSKVFNNNFFSGTVWTYNDLLSYGSSGLSILTNNQASVTLKAYVDQSNFMTPYKVALIIVDSFGSRVTTGLSFGASTLDQAKVSVAVYNDLLYLCTHVTDSALSWNVTAVQAYESSLVLDNSLVVADTIELAYAPSIAVTLAPTYEDAVSIAVPGVLTGVATDVGVLDLAATRDLAVSGSLVAADTVTFPDVPDYEGDYQVTGLRDVFPFCIPFDIYDFLTVMSAQREVPRWDVTLKFGRFGTFVYPIDLSRFNDLASLLRTLELMSFCVGLAVFTRRYLMGGG